MEKKKILFLCTGNSCRSQMAEGLARASWGNVFDFYSAGIKKHGLNPRAVKVMKEKKIDLTQHYSKTLDDLEQIKFDYIMTVCSHASETCPVLLGVKTIKKEFDDPPFLTKEMANEDEILNVYRRVRDEISDMIKKLPLYLEELIISDQKIGIGKEATKGALLVVNFEGKLNSGDVFDSSSLKGEPFRFVFGTGRVIKGWDLGLMGMKEGGKRTLYVPSYLAYGERKIGDKIPPHSDLSFEVELLEVLTRD